MVGLSKISIRRANEKDAPRLRAILQETFATTWLPQLSRQAAIRYETEDPAGSYVAQRGLLFWVAEISGEVVGLIDADGSFLNALHVHPKNAGAGIGTCLMDMAEDEIRDAGFDFVELETDTFNVRSRRFYAARGYEEVDSYPDEQWNSGITTLRLRKSLR